MRRCPQCNQTYDDATDFCVNDGTPLQYDSSFVSADVPTQIFTPVAAMAAPQRETGKLIYVAVGMMATVIVGLIAVLLYISSDKKEAMANQNQAAQTNPRPENKSASQPNNADPPDKPSVPAITADAARGLMDRWVKSQNDRNFGAYGACYSPTFKGKKRTTASVREMDYKGWMDDRRASMPKVINVQAEPLNISIEGDAATVRFVQRWRSVNHCDVGNKTILIKIFPDGPKIVFEDLEDLVNC